MFPELSAANGPLKEVALNGPEGEQNPIEHPELAYRRAQQRGIRDLAKRYRELRDRKTESAR